MFLLYSIIPSPASEKVDLSETAVSCLLSGEIGAMVVDHVALLSCPGRKLMGTAPCRFYKMLYHVQ